MLKVTENRTIIIICTNTILEDGRRILDFKEQEQQQLLLLHSYFHSQTFAAVLPDSSASYSNTATRLLRKDNFPVEFVL